MLSKYSNLIYFIERMLFYHNFLCVLYYHILVLDQRKKY